MIILVGNNVNDEKKTIPLILIKWLKDQVTKRILDNNALNETSTNK